MRRFLFTIGLILLFISLAGVAILSTRGPSTVTWVADLAAPTGDRLQNTALEGQAAARSLGERIFDSPAQGPATVLIAALVVALAIALWRAGRVWRWLIAGGALLVIVACVVLGIGGLGLFMLGGAAPMSAEPMQTAVGEPMEEAPAEEAVEEEMAEEEPAEEEPMEAEAEEEEEMAEEPTATLLSTSTPLADEPEQTQAAIAVTPLGGEGEPGEEPEEEPAAETPPRETYTFVEAEWPDRMGQDDTGVVRIELTRRAEDTLEVTVEVEGNVGETALVEVPEGATGSSLETAFGPDYRALAVANLESAGFDVQRSSAWAAYQPLSRERVQWAWFVDPLSEGDHTMVATVTGLWEPVDEPDACTQGSSSCIERELWYAILETRVHDPLIETGQLNLLSIVTGVLGSSVSIPWLVERVQGVVGRKVGSGIT